jgi:hypothetical protein
MLNVESMNQANKNCNAQFMEFTRIYAKKTERLICFFEGIEKGGT